MPLWGLALRFLRTALEEWCRIQLCSYTGSML